MIAIDPAPTLRAFHRLLLLTSALLLAFSLGCGDGEQAAGRSAGTPADGAPAAGATADGVTADGDEVVPDMLPRPFSAEEIRQAWSEGLEVVLRNKTPAGIDLQRWTVLAADQEGVEIEFAMTDAEGEVQGTPTVRRSTWQELASHGDFPSATTTREAATRPTPLGELEGWLYVQTDPEAEAVTRSFFAHRYPGAPVLMQVTQSNVVTLDMAMTRFEPGPGS